VAEAAITPEDLRAAVAAGHLTEAQAAGLTALAQIRAERRATMPRIDEPFELFRGFNEIFVSIGLILLFAGLGFFAPDRQLSALVGGAASPSAGVAFGWAVFMGVLIWLLSEYFTRRRRMIAPSIVLVLYLAFTLGTNGAVAMANLAGLNSIQALIAALTIAALAAIAFHLRFRLPFALFPAGICALAAALGTTGLVDEAGLERLTHEGPNVFVDIGTGTAFPLVTLVFGLAGFALAMHHDLRDPHRVTRHAACAFWLHLLAAPAIVNTAAFTLYSSGGTVATAGLIVFLLAMAAVAVAIDRRSFLLSGIGYVALMLIGLGHGNFPLVLILLGILILGLGAGWVPLRSALMRALPAFPAKGRLPPYARSGTMVSA
jgi:hypothetical protein